MFHRHFDEHVRHGRGPGGLGHGPFHGRRGRGGGIGGRVGGEYSPSPGVVYPTLTMLEEMGYASASQDQAGRKLFTLTPEGEKALADNKAQVDAIFARFGESDERRFAGYLSVKRAVLNLRAMV